MIDRSPRLTPKGEREQERANDCALESLSLDLIVSSLSFCSLSSASILVCWAPVALSALMIESLDLDSFLSSLFFGVNALAL